MIRRTGASRANNRADTTRTKRLCWSFFLVAIVCVFYVNFLRKLDQFGTEVEEASNKGATIQVAKDQLPQFSFVVKGQQNNTESDGSLVDISQGSNSVDSEESEVETNQLPQSPIAEEDEAVVKGQHNNTTESDDEPASTGSSSDDGSDSSLVETNQGSNGVDSEESEVVKDQLPQSSTVEEDEAIVKGQHSNTTVSDGEPVSAGSSSVVLSTVAEGSTNSTETTSTECKVHFKNENMRICHFIPYDGNFGDELGPAAILKILENKFYPCSVEDIPVLNLKTGRQPKFSCLFNLGSIFHMVQEGDHIWGTGTYGDIVYYMYHLKHDALFFV
jgi:hypothetical protein